MEENSRPVTAPNQVQLPILDSKDNTTEFYCDNCHEKFDYVNVIPKMVPCKDKHVFCEDCLAEAGKCLIDGYEFKTLPQDL